MDYQSSVLTWTCVTSNATLRLFGYLFLRWIPGHVFPPLIFTSFGIFAAAFTLLYLSRTAYVTTRSTTFAAVTEYVQLEDRDAAEARPLLNNGDGPQKFESTAVEATEIVTYLHQPPHPARVLLLGLPSPLNKRLSLASFAINALLTLMAWDLTFRSHTFYKAHDLSFARVGYVGPTEAKLLVREPHQDRWPLVVWYALESPTAAANTRLVDTIPRFTNETDFTHTVTIPRLRPETRYRYFTSSNHTGTFVTAPPPGATPMDGKFTFLHTSCIKPHFPYNPFDHPLSIAGFKHLAPLILKLNASFMLFLGDWIYADVPRLHGTSPEHYREHYRQMYASPDWPAVGSSLPWMHVIDDHEIANDWDRNNTGVYPAAFGPFTHYHAKPNPPPARPGATWYTFTWGTASFFLLDTRSYRSPIAMPDGPGKSMLGHQQLEDLLNWLRDDHHSPQWKFLISSVPFTKNWHYASARDTWASYLHERARILSTAWSISDRSAVVVLSGDRHEFAATKFPDPGDRDRERVVWEFSCSPLNQFFLPVRTYWQDKGDQEDVAVKYEPDGNSKFGVVEIDEGSGDQAVLTYRLFVDGKEKWKWVVANPIGGKRRAERERWV